MIYVLLTLSEVILTLMQIVYDANKLSKLVEEKKKMQNWLDFYQLKYSRNQSKRATMKVQFLNW